MPRQLRLLEVVAVLACQRGRGASSRHRRRAGRRAPALAEPAGCASLRAPARLKPSRTHPRPWRPPFCGGAVSALRSSVAGSRQPSADCSKFCRVDGRNLGPQLALRPFRGVAAPCGLVRRRRPERWGHISRALAAFRRLNSFCFNGGGEQSVIFACGMCREAPQRAVAP